MSTKTGDDTDTIGNIEEFLQRCLEGSSYETACKGEGVSLWACGRPRKWKRDGRQGRQNLR